MGVLGGRDLVCGLRQGRCGRRGGGGGLWLSSGSRSRSLLGSCRWHRGRHCFRGGQLARCGAVGRCWRRQCCGFGRHRLGRHGAWLQERIGWRDGRRGFGRHGANRGNGRGRVCPRRAGGRHCQIGTGSGQRQGQITSHQPGQPFPGAGLPRQQCAGFVEGVRGGKGPRYFFVGIGMQQGIAVKTRHGTTEQYKRRRHAPFHCLRPLQQRASHPEHQQCHALGRRHIHQRRAPTSGETPSSSGCTGWRPSSSWWWCGPPHRSAQKSADSGTDARGPAPRCKGPSRRCRTGVSTAAVR